MSTKRKQNNYINEELEWLELKAQQMKDFVDSKPYTELTDRMSYKETRNGGSIPMVVSTIEQQMANIRATLKDYALLIEAIAKLREKEEDKKIQSRGDQDISPMESGEI